MSTLIKFMYFCLMTFRGSVTKERGKRVHVLVRLFGVNVRFCVSVSLVRPSVSVSICMYIYGD